MRQDNVKILGEGVQEWCKTGTGVRGRDMGIG